MVCGSSGFVAVCYRFDAEPGLPYLIHDLLLADAIGPYRQDLAGLIRVYLPVLYAFCMIQKVTDRSDTASAIDVGAEMKDLILLFHGVVMLIYTTKIGKHRDCPVTLFRPEFIIFTGRCRRTQFLSILFQDDGGESPLYALACFTGHGLCPGFAAGLAQGAGGDETADPLVIV
jgi:hypothetical protein